MAYAADLLDINDAEARAVLLSTIEHDAQFNADDDILAIAEDPLVDIARYNPFAGVHPLRKMPIELARSAPIGLGFAYPVIRKTREIIPEPFDYLLSLSDAGDRSETGRWKDTQNRNYAYLLRPTYEAALMDERPPEYIDDDVMDLMVSSMLLGVNRRGQPLSGETIEQTIRAAFRCFDHTNAAGLTQISVDQSTLLARAYGVNSVYGKDGKRLDRDRLLGARRHMIRPLSEDSIGKLEKALPVTPAKWEEGGPSSRPRLTMDNGRRNGLRVIENLGLLYEDVMRPTILDADREYGFTLKRTKGPDHREIRVLGHEILAWQAYGARERKFLVKAARAIRGANWDEPAELLLNGVRSGEHVGEATQPSTIQRDLREPQMRLGMFKEELFTLPNGSRRKFVIVNHCYHDLRHTYAHDMYRLGKANGEEGDNLIAFVARRLGHAQPSTTARIYLWPDSRKVAMVGDIAQRGVRKIADA